MYNFNKKRLFSVLISPLLFNGFLFGMDEVNTESMYEEQLKRHKAEMFEKKKLNAKPILEKLGIKDNEYEILGSGAYGMVIKPKNSDYVWKLTYATIKNNLGIDEISNTTIYERFHPQYSASLLKNEKHTNVCGIIDVETFEVEGKKRYSGEDDKPYNCAIKMQYVDGKTLGEYIKEKSKTDKKFTVSGLYTLIYRVCDVLEKFRDHRLIYSDVKEENIMIDKKTNDFVIIDGDSATTPKVTRKNSIGASEREKQNMDLIALIEMAMRLVRGSIVNDKNQFDLLDFEENDIAKVEEHFNSIYEKIQNSKINNVDDFKTALLKVNR